MLVLSRKKNESIVVADSIVITIIEIRGDKVRLGIEAPRETPVHRKEVWDAINKQATTTAESPEEPVPIVLTDTAAAPSESPSPDVVSATKSHE